MRAYQLRTGASTAHVSCLLRLVWSRNALLVLKPFVASLTSPLPHIPFIICALLLSLFSISITAVTQIRGPGITYQALLPSSHHGSRIAFLSREDFSAFLPCRLASNCVHMTIFKNRVRKTVPRNLLSFRQKKLSAFLPSFWGVCARGKRHPAGDASDIENGK